MFGVSELVAYLAQDPNLHVLEVIDETKRMARIRPRRKCAQRSIAFVKQAFCRRRLPKKRLERFAELVVDQSCTHKRKPAIAFPLELLDKAGQVFCGGHEHRQQLQWT